MRPAFAAAALLASCAPPAQEPFAAADTQVYYCPGGFQFVARAGRESARLSLPGGHVTLPAVPAASGAKYADATATFWTKGAEALLDSAGGSQRGCSTDPSSGPWKNARDRGVTFRATGNEPGWVLDIVEDGETTLIADYGAKRYRFPTPRPEASGDRIVYKSASPEVVVQIERELCRDGMSGFPFQAAIEVRVEGARYQGCGNWIPQAGSKH